MKTHHGLPDRLKATARGLGEASQTDIDRRAAELAKMDGRSAFTARDLARAAAELGATANSPEQGSEDAIEDQGKRAARGQLENDSNLGEELTQQGMAEAEHDQRLASSEGAVGS